MLYMGNIQLYPENCLHFVQTKKTCNCEYDNYYDVLLIIIVIVKKSITAKPISNSVDLIYFLLVNE